MGFLDKLLGRDDSTRDRSHPTPGPSADAGPVAQAPPRPQDGEDERALARYRYLLRTAPPEELERVHAEAFAQLTPDQRAQVLESLGDLPESERPTSDDPQALARAATRAEVREPGTLQRSLAGSGAGGGRSGPGMGAMIGGSMLGTIAGVVVGSAIAQSLFGGYEQSPEAGEVGEGTGGDGADGTEAGGAEGADAGGGDVGSAEAGGDVGGGEFAGGDVGGGEFGGSDFGGGDLGGGFDF